MSDEEKKEMPVNSLMEKLAAAYGKDTVGKVPYIRTEATFAISNGISAEQAVSVLNPRYRQAVMRELLVALREGIPLAELKAVGELDDPDTTDISRIRKQYYDNLISTQKEAALKQDGKDVPSDMEPKSAGQNALYAETLQFFVTEIRKLVADQQKANQAVMEIMTRKENEEKKRFLSFGHMQEEQIRSLRETIDEKDDRIFRLQEVLQEQIPVSARQTEREESATSEKNADGKPLRADPEAESGFFRSRRKSAKAVERDKERGKEELFSLLCNPEINESQVIILQQAFEDNVPMDKIRAIATGKLSAERMKKALKVYGLKDRSGEEE